MALEGGGEKGRAEEAEKTFSYPGNPGDHPGSVLCHCQWWRVVLERRKEAFRD